MKQFVQEFVESITGESDTFDSKHQKAIGVSICIMIGILIVNLP